MLECFVYDSINAMSINVLNFQKSKTSKSVQVRWTYLVCIKVRQDEIEIELRHVCSSICDTKIRRSRSHSECHAFSTFKMLLTWVLFGPLISKFYSFLFQKH